MNLDILLQDVLESPSDAIVLAIDGAARGMEGNVARAFARRWPDLWQEIEDEVRYPVPLGQVYEVEVAGEYDCPFKVVVLAPTLHHLETLSDAGKRSVVRTALEEAIRATSRYRLSSASTTVMRGGWRLQSDSAFTAMLESLERVTPTVSEYFTLKVCTLDSAEHQRLKLCARTFGWF